MREGPDTQNQFHSPPIARWCGEGSQVERVVFKALSCTNKMCSHALNEKDPNPEAAKASGAKVRYGYLVHRSTIPV